MNRLPAARPDAATKSFARAANWTVGLAAAALVLTSVGGYFYHREQLAAIAVEHLRLIVTGPASLQAGVAAEYTVSTTAISGQPLPAQIEVSLLAPDGKRLKAYKEAADDRGRLRIAIPANLKLPRQVRLKVVAEHRNRREEAETTLAVEPVRYGTQLALDRPLYRPGETVYFRSPALSCFGLAEADRRMPLHFEILGPGGAMVPAAQWDVVAERGVGSGAFKLPGNSAEGQYTLLARSPDKAFPEERKSFLVRRGRPPPLNEESADPAGVKVEPKPSEASSERDFALIVGADTFAAAAPLEFQIRAAQAGRPLVAAAYCRGVQVGEQPLVTKAGGPAANPVTIPLDDAVGGAIRLIVYDYGAAPPKPLAERIVYRRPTRVLNVQATGHRPKYSPGETVEMTLLVTNEKGEPVPAVLGVAVVDEALLSSSGNAGQSWGGSCTAAPFQARQYNCRTNGARPPFMYDNLERIRSNYEKCLADYRAGRTPALNTLTTASFFGGLGLVLLVAMLGLMRIVWGMHLWIPAVGATTCCLIVGAILMDPGRPAPGLDTAVAFCSYAPPASKGVDTKSSAWLPVRESAHRSAVGPASAGSDFAGTLLWRPLLIAGPDGKASISFQLPAAAAAFLVTVDAHDGAGRIGAGRVKIVCGRPDRKAAAPEAR